MMSRQLSPPLRTEREADGRRVLLEPLVVDLGKRFKGLEGFADEGIVTIPAGFDTDFSSIPAALQWMLGDYRRYDIAGVVHDWLYRVGAPRGAADAVWRHIARSGEYRVGPVRGIFGWAGLRMGGWRSYRSRQRERLES